jgi:hypothetical protein
VREPVYFDKITKRITGLAHHHTGDLIAATRYTSLRGLLIVMMLQGMTMQVAFSSMTPPPSFQPWPSPAEARTVTTAKQLPPPPSLPSMNIAVSSEQGPCPTTESKHEQGPYPTSYGMAARLQLITSAWAATPAGSIEVTRVCPRGNTAKNTACSSDVDICGLELSSSKPTRATTTPVRLATSKPRLHVFWPHLPRPQLTQMLPLHKPQHLGC